MKKIFITLATFCMLQQLKAQDTKIIAHRGAWKEFNLPENSIAALQKAIEIKSFGSEFDVRRTLDGKLVVNHDPTHFGDTIELKTYTELNAKKLSNGEDLPLLEDYFKTGTASKHHTLLVCEIKAALLSNTTSQLTATETIALAKNQVSKTALFISVLILKCFKPLELTGLMLLFYISKTISRWTKLKQLNLMASILIMPSL